MASPFVPRARGWLLSPLASVRVRITLAAMGVTAVAFGIAGWLLVTSVDDTSEVSVLQSGAEDYLNEVAANLRAGQSPEEALRSMETTPPVAPVIIADERGDILATYPEPGQGDNGIDGVAVPEGGEERVDEYEERVDDDGGGEGVDAPAPWVPSGASRLVETPDGTMTVTAAPTVDRVVGSVVDRLSWSLMIGMPALVALVGVIAWVLVGRALRPVEAIRAEVERISGSTMHRRVPEPSTHDEVGRLAHTMNTMLDRLETSAAQQRRFVSDASHELRSPVSAIRTGVEVARRKGERADWPKVADIVLDEEARLEALLDDLLLLATHDENGNGAHRRPTTLVNMDELAAAEARRPRRVPVELVRLAPPAGDLVPPPMVAGVAEQLARALGNLVDNAARHATSRVQVTLSPGPGPGPGRAAGTVRVVVVDDGPGIPADDRQRVFERFTRLDDGRARHAGGSGLGLALVRAIATHHHGRVWAEANPTGGARLVTELPAASVLGREMRG